MTKELYIPQRIAVQTLEFAEHTRLKVSEAVLGASFAQLMGAENDTARLMKMLATVSVPLCTYDRGEDGQRRADRLYRKSLLPTMLEMVSPDFEIDEQSLEAPGDYAQLATLTTPERELLILRIKGSVHTPMPNEIIDASKLDSTGTLPGIVQYNLLVTNTTGSGLA